jgi:hypothetical protein
MKNNYFNESYKMNENIYAKKKMNENKNFNRILFLSTDVVILTHGKISLITNKRGQFTLSFYVCCVL